MPTAPLSIPWLDPDSRDCLFPPPQQALLDPNGLLAAGGDLRPARLLSAYRQGIFPWYSAGQPILWWCPDPRAVLFPEQLKISRSLAKAMRHKPYTITLDTAFRQVVEACAAPRRHQDGTWITAEMCEAYCELHRLGYAHAAEAWQHDTLVGGLYGVALGRVFFGESMFSRADNASKIAFVYLVRQLQAWGYTLIDCQVPTAHLHSLGATLIPRAEFLDLLERWCTSAPTAHPWRLALTDPQE